MKNSYKVLTAAALAAVFATSVSAQDIPLNNTVAGGQGEEKIDGQAGLLGFGGLGAAGVAVAVVTVVAITAIADNSSSSTTN